MATKKASSAAQSVSEMQAAAQLVLQREEMRHEAAEKRAKRRRRSRRQEERRAVKKLYQSIEVIKWCIVGICTVWVISFIIGIVILVKVQNRVTEIDGQVKRIQHVLENPFANAAAFGGKQLDDKLREAGILPDLKDDGK